MRSNGWILVDIHTAPGENEPQSGFVKHVAANVLSAEQWMNQLGTALIFGYQFPLRSCADDKSLVQAAGDTPEESPLNIFSERFASQHHLLKDPGLRVGFE